MYAVVTFETKFDKIGGDDMPKKQVHQPYQKLKGVLRERGLTYADIAKILNVSETAISHKVNGRSDFYISQVRKIQNEYGFESEIFLAQ